MKIPAFALFAILPLAAGAAQSSGRGGQRTVMLQAAAEPARYSGELPVRVQDIELENEIRAGNHATTIADLEKCGMIYPNGSFLWAKPDTGVVAANKPTCVAEVYMKMAPKDGQPGGASDKVLAVAHIPAGTSVKCNIGQFPESGYLPAAGDPNVLFPADNAPTQEEVEAVMNREQKQNAGMKTATSALIGGIGMFLASGDNKSMAERVGLTAAGAAGAGGLAYASTQAGKVAGDTIMSAGVNAAAGAVIGNMGAGMAGGGEAIMLVKDCIGEEKGQKCLWGYVTSGGDKLNEISYVNRLGEVMSQAAGGSGNNYIRKYNVSNIKIGGKSLENITPAEWQVFFINNPRDIACFEEKSDGYEITEEKNSCADNFWVKIDDVAKVGGTQLLAMIVGFDEKLLGTKQKDFKKSDDMKPVGRNPDGSRNHQEEHGMTDGLCPEGEDGSALCRDFTIEKFMPLTLGADDGDVIDFGNKARIKGTALGAGSGAAVGALASYKGAQDEIEERYFVEMDIYEGSLQQFYCITGTRYLGKYNDDIIIPAMR